MIRMAERSKDKMIDGIFPRFEGWARMGSQRFRGWVAQRLGLNVRIIRGWAVMGVIR